MKNRKTYIQLLLLLFPFLIATAQVSTPEPTEEKRYITLEGIVKDQSSKKPLPYATIVLAGTGVSTMSNADGAFTFKIEEPDGEARLAVSHVGYINASVRIEKDVQAYTLWLAPAAHMLGEVIVRGREPRTLVEEAIRKIPANYSAEPTRLTGFYRESAKKRKRYINIAEAIVHLDKSSYSHRLSNDKVQILKGRRLVSPKASDTLSVKVLGGPNNSIYLDIVKNPDLLLSREILPFYDFHLEEATLINDRPQYVVSFVPNRELPFALYHGKLYIDKEKLSFTEAVFFLDLSNRLKAIQSILHKKPKGLHFKPTEVAYRIKYSEYNGKTHLGFVRFELQFKCDWRRKLFATSYTVLAEMVITDIEKATQKITSKDAFKRTNVFSDDAALFFDKDFWGPYNIIKPDESLEHAVNKLKKQPRFTSD